MGSALESDIAFGKKLIREGRVKPEQVQECLDLINELARQGAVAMPSLESLLLKRGYLKADQGENTQNVQRSTPRPRDSQKMAAPDGERIGKYIKCKKIGEGGMGEVWLGWDTKLERWVALKFIKSRDAEELARFQREAQTAAKLSHPNIAAVYEAHLNYISMQFIEGMTLHSFPRDNVRLLVDIMRQAAMAVHFAHQQGIIHRDLKPPNIMVSQVATSTTTHSFAPGSRESVQVFVMDFGLAKTMSVDSSLSASGTVIGTPMYMSPEQAQANRAVDARADIYSLGATLYELLTDTPPFTGTNIFQLLQKIVSEDPLPVRHIKPEVDPELETIAMKCLEKDPGRRYQSALEFAEELTRWLEGEPILAHPPSGFYRLRKRVAKNPWAWAMSAAAAAIVLFGLAIVWLISSGADDSVKVAELVQQAERAYYRGEPARAQELVDQAEAIHRNHPDVRYWAARLLIRRYQHSRGVPEARIVRGTIELIPLRAETQEERHWRVEVLREMPEDGMALFINEKYDEADDRFRQVKPDAPGAWEAEFYRGVIRYLRGDFSTACRLIQPHARRDPLLTLPVWIRTLMALAQEVERQGEDAGPYYTQAEGAALDFPGAQGKVLRAQVLVLRGKAEAARGNDADAHFRNAVQLAQGLDDATLGDAYLALADYLRSRGDPLPPYELALDAYGKASYASAYLRRAEAYLARFDFDLPFGKADLETLKRAEEEYQKALAARSGYVDAEIGLAGVVRRRTEKFEDEIKTLDGLAARHPRNHSILFARATSWRLFAYWRDRRGEDSVGDYQAAIRDYTALLEINPKNDAALLARCEAQVGVAQQIFRTTGDLALNFKLAIDDATLAIGVNGKNSDAYVARGLARNSLAHHRHAAKQDPRDDFEAALKDLTQALALNPRNVMAYRCRGLTSQNFGMSEAAFGRPTRRLFDNGLEDLSRAISLNKLDGESARWRGSAHENLAAFLFERREPHEAELEAAVADYSEAARINPRDAEAYLRRGIALGSLKRLDEADKSFDLCGQADPLLKPTAERYRRLMRQK